MAPEIVRAIPGPAGSLETLLDLPTSEPRVAVVFGHPHPLHGGTMHTKAVYRAAKALAQIGCAVLRFNFRGVGQSAGVHTGGPGEMDDFRAALDFMEARYPGLPLWAAGFSFGAWIALSVGATDARVSLMLAIAPPVNRDGFDALLTSTKPKFFIHGERDELISIKEMRRFYGWLPEPKELVEIEAASHLFEGRTADLGDAVEDLLSDYPTLRAGGQAR